MVSIGAAAASIGLIVFSGRDFSTTLVAAGLVMLALGIIGAFRFLHAARREERQADR